MASAVSRTFFGKTAIRLLYAFFENFISSQSGLAETSYQKCASNGGGKERSIVRKYFVLCQGRPWYVPNRTNIIKKSEMV